MAYCFLSFVKMFTEKLKKLTFLVIVQMFLCALSLCVSAEDKEEIKITMFKAHNDFTESDTFKIKETIVLYVLWSIPEGVDLRGRATIKIEGQRFDGGKWLIKDKKDLRPNFASHYWGWDCRHKIPKKAKLGTVGTATVELAAEGFEPVTKFLNFKIEDR